MSKDAAAYTADMIYTCDVCVGGSIKTYVNRLMSPTIYIKLM